MVNITTNIIFTWSVCVLLDVMAIKLPPVGFDLLAGIKNKRRQHSLIGMLMAIIIYKPKTIIETRYKELYELKQLEQAEVKEVEPKQENELIQEVNTPAEQEKKLKHVNSNVVKLEHGLKNLDHKVKMYILENYKDGDTINVKEIRDKFKLTARQWSGIRDVLSVLIIRGTKTIFIPDKKEDILL